MVKVARKTIRAAIGDPRKAHRELQAFGKSARAFSSDRPRLIDKYEDKWVAVHDKQVVASAKTLGWLTRKLDEKKLPRKQIIIRRIAKTQRTMIL